MKREGVSRLRPVTLRGAPDPRRRVLRWKPGVPAAGRGEQAWVGVGIMITGIKAVVTGMETARRYQDLRWLTFGQGCTSITFFRHTSFSMRLTCTMQGRVLQWNHLLLYNLH
jgi:hypothetical protein